MPNAIYVVVTHTHTPHTAPHRAHGERVRSVLDLDARSQ